MRKAQRLRLVVLSAFVVLLFSSLTPAQSSNGVPIFKITAEDSTVRFSVKASVSIEGTFDKWDATLTFPSTDPTTGVLDVKIQAASVDTGSGFKNDKLKSSDFFNADHDPYITFKSTKVVATGPNTFEVDGNFTIRGVTRSEKLTLTASGEGMGSGAIVGTMAFDRKNCGPCGGECRSQGQAGRRSSSRF